MVFHKISILSASDKVILLNVIVLNLSKEKICFGKLSVTNTS